MLNSNPSHNCTVKPCKKVTGDQYTAIQANS